MLDSKIKAKIDEAIKILNDLNDNEKVSAIKKEKSRKKVKLLHGTT